MNHLNPPKTTMQNDIENSVNIRVWLSSAKYLQIQV